MNTEEIIEGNRLIVEFMGFKRKIGALNHYSVPKGEHLKYKAITLDLKQMPYNTSWDWLMPVVEKIERMTNTLDDSGIRLQTNMYAKEKIRGEDYSKVYAYGFSITFNQHEKFKVESEDKIKSVFLCVIQFIKWYNQNKPQP